MPHVERTHPASDTGHSFGTQHEYAQMFQMIFGATISQIVHTAALSSLPEHLAQGRATPAEIAAAESLHVDATLRLMRACAAIGLMTHDSQAKCAATPLLHTLPTDAAHSLRGLALVMTKRWCVCSCSLWAACIVSQSKPVQIWVVSL